MKITMFGHGMVADTHIAAIADNTEGMRLHQIVGRDADRTQAYAAKASKTLGYTVSAQTDVAQATVRAKGGMALIITPPNVRQPLIQVLVEARVPILMEKPIERTFADARRLVELCESASVPLGIVLQHRMRFASQALYENIKSKKLGTLVSVDIRVPWWRDQAYYDEPGRGTYARDGGGAMISQAIHTLDLALALCGPVRTVSALMHKSPLHKLEAEDWAAALLEFENGCIGAMTATTAAYPGGAESITIQGTKASAHLCAGVLELAYLDGRTETIGATATTGGGADPMAFTHAWHQNVLEDFTRAITEHRDPVASGRSALKAHAVIDAMERSNRSSAREEVTQ